MSQLIKIGKNSSSLFDQRSNRCHEHLGDESASLPLPHTPAPR